ncbi:autotransporter outer membrane beta-barrel domain-containing protein [Sphingobium aromaticiconvertens]|uniref:autotransporter outer membrane beta-barrel domain-containing protein n=1 Tax=Sphingobium aromaticiconvertens TaxID=365341 RepID=UPI0030183200
MRHYLTCTAMASVLVALAAGEASAETTISTATTTPVATATVANGVADDITISSAGSITLTSGAAVTINSNNKVSNAGTIKMTGVDNATGILAMPGTSGDIIHSGTITLDEDYTATDTDSDGDVDGPFAKGSNRNGIWVQSGAAHTGALTSSGTITIEGNQSTGIRLDGPLNGALSTSGTISVVGDNSYGVLANAVTGDVTLRGSTAVAGANSVGAALMGDIGGALKIQGTIVSTGYRSTTAPTDVSKLDADDLLQGGPAVRIAGNVAGGIIFDAPPTLSETDADVDKDGLPDATEGTSSITSYGAAPAVEIGAADRDISIGAVAADTSGYGLIVRGSMVGSGVYAGVNATGLSIGGLGGGVTIAKGLDVRGAIAAASLDSNATAVRIGSGANVGAVAVSGSLGGAGSALDGTVARGLLIESGANVNSIAISGTVSAAALSSEKGTAVAIADQSGTVTSVSNTGKITASGGKTGANVALDLSANSSGVTITQALASDTAAAPSISGDVRLGSGNDQLAVSAGTIIGDVALGGGDDNVTLSGTSALTGAVNYGAGNSNLTLADSAKITGNIDFGGGAGTLTLGGTSSLTGSIANSGGMALVLNGGSLNATNSGTLALSSLTASSGSTIGVNIDGATGTNTLYDVAGAASFASGSKVQATLTQVSGSEGDYVIVRAGTLSGTPDLSSNAVLPYMFKGTLTSNASTGEVTLSIAEKSVADLGLNGSLARAYPAIFAALDNDSAIADTFLSVADGATLNSALRQMLPDHAGGTFEAVTSGSRATARILSDPGGMARTQDGRLGFWLNQIAFGSAKSVGSTASYDITGWGASGGAEYLTDIGAFGASLAYIHGNDSSGGSNSAVDSDQFELAAHWRGQWGPLQGFARVSAATIDFGGTRRFITSAATRTAEGDWSGKLYSATAGASYEKSFGRFSLRPAIGIDYYRLKESGYAETGGGDAFNLTVDGRTSDELTANGTLTAAYDMGSLNRADGWFRVELEGGRRQIVGGSLGNTIAHFKDGDDFTLVAEERTNGWTGRARLIGGTDTFRVGGEFSAEEQQNHVAIAFRATVNFIL